MKLNLSKYTSLGSDISIIIVVVAIVILASILSRQFFFRIDLTSEKRYTLSDNSKEILADLDDIVFVRVYLEGELNIPFRKFQENIQDMLDELKVYGGRHLQYEFVNPFEDADAKKQGEILEDLYNKGLRPTNIYQRDKEGGNSEKIIFPSAMVSYKNVKVPLNLLLNNAGLGAEQNLNNSIEALEYSLVSTIKTITNHKVEKIAFLEGQGELNEFEVNDISRELSKIYQIDRGTINSQPGILDDYKALIIAKPTLPFSEPDKFVLDQYIMKGGKVLWLIDAVQISLDSLIEGSTMAFIPPLNIDDMLFRYGVRINPVLLEDLQCNVIPVNVALIGNPANFQPAPWLYYPLLRPQDGNPITRNLNLVCCKFVNILDTIEARSEIRKFPLLSASSTCRTKNVPAIISLTEVKDKPKPTDFNQQNILVGVLLEGKFESAFKNRGMSKYFSSNQKIIEKSNPNRMVIIADGDIIRNDVRYTSNGPAITPLGFDRFTRQTFGNKEFLVNIMQYLADDQNLLSLRGREFKIRLLDKEKISQHHSKWILINMIYPCILVILCGIVYLFIRKQKYARI